ncbi:MAG: glycosyltransferase family 39 protein [Alphaproteobacteria bacterium]|nr:glycosyltransferase family 39 protein [Alphaproteobacteria bacterium]
MRSNSIWLRGWHPYALLAGLCFVLYLPGIASIPPLDRDEARFAQATRQMLQTGDFLRIRFQDEARNKKPAGIYWLQAAAVAAFSTPESTAIWPYRLPSIAGALIAVLLTFAIGGPLFARDNEASPRVTAFVAAVLLGSALGVVAEAHIAKTDAALLAAIVAGQGALGLAYVQARSGRAAMPAIAAMFWIAETAAILLKGPVGPSLTILTAMTLSIADRDWRWLRTLYPLAGIIFMMLAIVPWIVAIESATTGGFLADSLGRDFSAKLIGPEESHGAPPLTYLLLAVATFWPGSLLLVPALARGWRNRVRPAERFLLAWVVPAWIVLELVPTKLPHYALPLYPALALLAGAALVEGARAGVPRWLRYSDIAAKALWGLVTIALAVALLALPLLFADRFSVISVLGAAVLLGLATTPLARWSRPPFVTAAIVGVSAAFVLPAASVVLPSLDRLWLSRSAADFVAKHSSPIHAPVIAVGYSEPSLVFLLGGHVRLTHPGDAAGFLTAGSAALVSDRDDALFHQSLSARGLSAQASGNVEGFDYSSGRHLVLTLYDIGHAE